ncbi:MAG: hypothetical protein Kow00121_08140 [Elainellaceae cyanobacterium]
MRTRSPAQKNSRSSDWAIELLPGLSEQDQVRLKGCGIKTTLQLLQKAKTPAQRQALAAQLQIHIQHVNKWVALANLSRIPTVGCQHCGLLLHAGISSPAQLAQTPLPRLHRQLQKLHVAMMQREDLCPDLGEVSRWIEQARALSLTQR